MDKIEFFDPIEFEWDEYNTTKIRLRHNITQEEAEKVFFGEHSVIFDEQHSQAEQRYQLVGESGRGKILFVVFTFRGKKIRIISARSANKKERINYGKKT